MVTDLIQQIYTPDGIIQYINQGRVKAAGVSLEFKAHLPAEVELEAGLDIQRAVFGDRTALPNSPGELGKFRLSLPVWRRRVVIGGGFQAMGQRNSYAGIALPWNVLPEAVVTSKPFWGGYEVSMGVKNLSNTFYRVPTGLSGTVDNIIGDGRTYFVNLAWRRPPHDGPKTSRNKTTQTTGGSGLPASD